MLHPKEDVERERKQEREARETHDQRREYVQVVPVTDKRHYPALKVEDKVHDEEIALIDPKQQSKPTVVEAKSEVVGAERVVKKPVVVKKTEDSATIQVPQNPEDSYETDFYDMFLQIAECVKANESEKYTTEYDIQDDDVKADPSYCGLFTCTFMNFGTKIVVDINHVNPSKQD
jgi:hypothetical protein